LWHAMPFMASKATAIYAMKWYLWHLKPPSFMLRLERKLKKQGYTLIAGVDEAGRGPLAGPVVAAAVILNKTRFKNRIDDSKKLSEKQRESAFLEIIDNSLFGIGIINEQVIDEVNIFSATRLAMESALGALFDKIPLKKKTKAHILIDGNIKPEVDFDFSNIIKGDCKSKSIASASILAKVTRDRIMTIYHKIFPDYGFNQHKGYPTKKHRDKIKKIGPCLIHRSTFNVS